MKFISGNFLVLIILFFQQATFAQKPEAKKLFIKAKEQIELENNKDAEVSLRKALAIEPGYEDALSTLGELLIKVDDFAGAKTCYEKLLKQKPANAEYMVSLSAAYYNLDKSTEAIEWAGKAISLNPKSDFAYYKRGLALLLKGDTTAALNDINKAIELDSEYFNYHYSKGFVFYNQDKNELAKTEFLKCRQLDSTSTDALFYLGAIQFYLKDFTGSAKIFDQLFVEDPDYSDAYYYRAKCDMNTEDYTSAIKFFSKGIALDSAYADYDMYYSRGIAFYNADKPYNSIKDLALFVKLTDKTNHNLTSAYNFLSFCHYDIKDYETGLKYAGKSLAIDSNDADGWYAKGICLLKLNKKTEACQALRTAVEKGKEGIDDYLAECK
jgi:tetratricopeptide (TPR) repeat protein